MFSFGDVERRRGGVDVADFRTECTPTSVASDTTNAENAVWVFGYGSLCWFPGFEYKESMLGCITGFKRRFWQGNATHRGTAVKPGRVATVVEEKEGVVWGRAFLVTGDAALPYLSQRECKLGGYVTKNVSFYPYDPMTPKTSNSLAFNIHSKKLSFTDSGCPSPDSKTLESPNRTDSFALNLLARLRLEEENSKTKEPFCGLNDLSAFSLARFFAPGCDSGFSSPEREELKSRLEPFSVMMYVATEENRHWLGKAPLHSIAEQIAECHGPSGSNADYLLNLARFMRTELPLVKDDHLFELERLVRERMAARGQRELAEEAGARVEAPSHQYTSRLPSKKLRCLNI